jgi:hypothetical protein
MRRLPPCLAVLLLAAAAAAQDRRAHPGRVLDAGGKPVAGADVTLLFAPPFAAELGCTDVVRTKSDAEGRFRAELLTGASYVAWATTDVGWSGVVEIDAARQCELPLRAKPRPREHRIGGLDAWTGAGPFSLRLCIAGVPGLLPDLRVVDGKVELPPLPQGRVEGVLLDRQGIEVCTIGIGSEVEEAVCPPQTLAVHVADADGKAVAGAAIAQVSRSCAADDLGRNISNSYLVPRAVTDAEGNAQVRVACPKDPWDSGDSWLDINLLASKEGYDGSLCGFADGLYLDGKKADAERVARKRLDFVLRPGKAFTGRVSPAGPRRVALRASVRVAVEQNGWTDLSFVVCAQADKDGRFALPPLPAAISVEDAVLAPSPRSLAADDPFRRSVARAPFAMPVLHPGDGRELAIDLGGLQTVRLQVSDAAGAPLGGATVLVAGRKDDTFGVDEALIAGRTDLPGRLAVALPPGKWLVLASDADGWTQRVVEVAVGDDKPVALALQPFARMPLRVLDGDGKPLPGASAQIREVGWMGGGTPEEQAATSIANALCGRRMAEARSDADGRLELRFVPDKHLRIRFAVMREPDDAHPGVPGQSDNVTLEALDAPLEVRIR